MAKTSKSRRGFLLAVSSVAGGGAASFVLPPGARGAGIA
jgi:hypothetical protein